jgi:hypothetical protein
MSTYGEDVEGEDVDEGQEEAAVKGFSTRTCLSMVWHSHQRKDNAVSHENIH